VCKHVCVRAGMCVCMRACVCVHVSVRMCACVCAHVRVIRTYTHAYTHTHTNTHTYREPGWALLKRQALPLLPLTEAQALSPHMEGTVCLQQHLGRFQRCLCVRACVRACVLVCVCVYNRSSGFIISQERDGITAAAPRPLPKVCVCYIMYVGACVCYTKKYVGACV